MMVLRLLLTETRIAEEDIKCDATEWYFDMLHANRASGKEFKLKFSGDVVVLLKNKHGLIKKGKPYIYREFFDEFDGGIYTLVAIPEMDKVCQRNNIYYNSIIKLIKKD